MITNLFYKTKKLFLRITELFREKGIYYVVRAGARTALIKITGPFWYRYYVKNKSKENFVFNNRPYPYFYHKYRNTWKNERAVEIPIVWTIIKKSEGKNILELGNVLSHYFDYDHDTVDK